MGACCSATGECAETTGAECDGDYEGDGTTCDDADVCSIVQPDGTLCHIPPGNHGNAHTITVGWPAVQAHLNHGDTMGPCPVDGEQPGVVRGGHSIRGQRNADSPASDIGQKNR